MKIKEDKKYKYPSKNEIKTSMDKLFKNMDEEDKYFLLKIFKELKEKD